MSTSTLKREYQDRLGAFLWSQWGQMGLPATTGRHDRWAADPEALLLISLEVGREDARLVDGVLAWLLANERRISVQRLRNLARDDDDRRLIEAALGWSGERRPRARLRARPGEPVEPRPFLRGSRIPVADPDPAFLAQGFIKANAPPPSGLLAPDLRLPINFAFRLRDLLGVGVKAEVMRVLLTAGAPRYSAQAIAASTAFTKRNVQEALNSLRGVGVVVSSELGNEMRFEAALANWRPFLELGNLPLHVDWPQLFAAYRLILRWLNDPTLLELSDYMLFSETRSLVEEVLPDLQFAGIGISSAGPVRSDYLEDFAEQLLAQGPI